MCKYCEGENKDRKILEDDGHFNPVCIWKENDKEYLLIDNSESKLIKINFCPMCGKNLDNN